MLESIQFRANVSKSKYVIMGTGKLRTERIKDTESDPILVGEHEMENSASRFFLGDMINKKGNISKHK